MPLMPAAADPRAALIAQLTGPPPGGPPPPSGGGPNGGNGAGLSKTEIVQSLVQDIHDAMRIFTDPTHVNVLSRMLQVATALQKEVMVAAHPPPGGGGGPGPGGPGGPPAGGGGY